MASILMLLNWFAFWILQFLLCCLTLVKIYEDLFFLRLFFIPGHDAVCTVSCSAPLHLLLECQAEDCMSLKVKLRGFKLGEEDPVSNKLRTIQFYISSSPLKLLWSQKRCHQCLTPRITRAVSALLDLWQVLDFLWYCWNRKGCTWPFLSLGSLASA